MSENLAQLGRDWLAAFNDKDLERLVGLYADDCTHTSPKLRVQRPESGGKLHGKAALHAWWEDAFRRLPGLRYESLTITANEQRVFLEYLRHAPGEASYPVAEVFEVTAGKIAASRVYHG
jgi:ketosteroid isomerase-like protein